MILLRKLADLGALGNYPGSPYLRSESEILLDSPEQEDIGRNCFLLHYFCHFLPLLGL